MRPTDREKLREYFFECSMEMFQTNGISAAESGDPGRSGEWVVAAVIGFGGEVIRGTLTTIMPIALLRATYPARVEGVALADEDVVDWAGEFANQLLGRIKHKLLAHGVELSLSTPKTMFAEYLRLGNSARGVVCAAGFKAGDMPIGMWLDVLVEDDREIFTAPAVDAGNASEGELVLF